MLLWDQHDFDHQGLRFSANPGCSAHRGDTQQQMNRQLAPCSSPKRPAAAAATAAAATADVLLHLRRVAQQQHTTPTYIFDERVVFCKTAAVSARAVKNPVLERSLCLFVSIGVCSLIDGREKVGLPCAQYAVCCAGERTEMQQNKSCCDTSGGPCRNGMVSAGWYICSCCISCCYNRKVRSNNTWSSGKA